MLLQIQGNIKASLRRPTLQDASLESVLFAKVAITVIMIHEGIKYQTIPFIRDWFRCVYFFMSTPIPSTQGRIKMN